MLAPGREVFLSMDLFLMLNIVIKSSYLWVPFDNESSSWQSQTKENSPFHLLDYSKKDVQGKLW